MLWDTIMVELVEGPSFISHPGDFGAADIEPGMPVKVAFVSCEDKMGHSIFPSSIAPEEARKHTAFGQL